MAPLQRYYLILASLLLVFLVYYSLYLMNTSSNVSIFSYSTKPKATTTVHNITGTTKPPPKLLTIFTTFIDSPTKRFVHRNVIINWAELSPRIQPVLFGNFPNGSKIVELARLYGWILHPLPRSSTMRPPFFKDMFRLAAKLTDSVFYGYCNGDILFNKGMVSTLEGVLRYSKVFNSTMVIGRRTNVNINETSDEPLYKTDLLTRRAKQFGKLYFTVAEDYFFIRLPQLFPWHTLKDVVIGIPAYDNYVVAQAIRGNVSVVDATNTILAFHQTGKDGNLAGAHNNKEGRYNKNVIGPYNYGLGSTQHAQFVSVRDFTGRIFIQKRIFRSQAKRAVENPPATGNPTNTVKKHL